MRTRHQGRAAALKRCFHDAGLPVMDTPSHIVPVFVGDAELCKAASDMLLERHNVYVQPINYPTVAKGTERLRITPTPFHSDAHVAALVDALVDVWKALGLAFEEPKIVKLHRKPQPRIAADQDAACSFPDFKRAAE